MIGQMVPLGVSNIYIQGSNPPSLTQNVPKKKKKYEPNVNILAHYLKHLHYCIYHINGTTTLN